MFKQIGMHLRKFRIGPFGITAFVILVLNACMRLALIAHNWPLTNSDEDTLGLMALHIAYHGQFPIFFYGQSFLGPLEAYVGAVIFLLSSPTVFSLRLGMILLFTLFLVSMYLLTSLLYTKKLALFTLVMLSLGSPEVLLRELAAQGGHPETPLFGAVIVLFTTWLALTYKPNLSPRDQKRRIPYALLPGNKCGRLQGSQAPMFFNARLYMAPGGWVLLFFGALRPSLPSGSFAPRSWHILLRREGQRSSGSLV